MGPVHHVLLDKTRVGNDHVEVVHGPDLGGSHVDSLDGSNFFPNRHQVTNGDGTLDEQDKAANKIGRYVLKTKPDSDPEGRQDEGQRTEVDPHRFKGNKHPEENDSVMEEPPDRVLHSGIQPFTVPPGEQVPGVF